MKTDSWTSFLRPIALTLIFIAVDLSSSDASEVEKPELPTSPVERLQSLLETSGRLENAEIQIQVEDHIAHLQGWVPTLDEAEFIAESAIRIDEIFGVVQALEIRGSLADAAARAETALRESPALDAKHLEVDVNPEGHAILKGTISCLDEADIARELVSRVEGIRSIETQLEVDPLLLRSESAIVAQLLLDYGDDPIFSRYGIVPQLHDGILTLEGSVASHDEKDFLMLGSLVTGVMECRMEQVEVRPALARAGISEREYQTSDILKVFELVNAADPRLEDATIVAGFVGSRLSIDAEVPSLSARNACLANAHALPGVNGIDARIHITHDAPALSSNN
ncbi:hypothetical protein HNR46_002109 [Haloferula luteola]|uniref:BON domain-containing protein n=1 Tax=Haloferula luteola TaxID=595692 RepID=A0A840VDA7_9BACT|nr:BON domain-containing protein [Haloferula luteola]MBB5351870.1 hypothetical protein [Haloferula luteola]